MDKKPCLDPGLIASLLRGIHINNGQYDPCINLSLYQQWKQQLLIICLKMIIVQLTSFPLKLKGGSELLDMMIIATTATISILFLKNVRIMYDGCIEVLVYVKEF